MKSFIKTLVLLALLIVALVSIVNVTRIYKNNIISDTAVAVEQNSEIQQTSSVVANEEVQTTKSEAGDSDGMAPRTSVAVVYEYICADSTNGSVVYGVIPNAILLTYNKVQTETLLQTISASGVRYANEAESVVFWEKDGIAMIEEGGVVAHTGCVLTKTTQTYK